jgi:putative FmdB family regulatory protein
MPIYAYKCSSCGHALDVLQKVSDAPLTECPHCQAATFAKQLTAAGFQLRGNGWYATDFKNGSGKRESTSETKGSETKGSETKSSETKGSETKSPDSKGSTSSSESKTEKAASTSSGSCGHGGCSSCS